MSVSLLSNRLVAAIVIHSSAFNHSELLLAERAPGICTGGEDTSDAQLSPGGLPDSPVMAARRRERRKVSGVCLLIFKVNALTWFLVIGWAFFFDLPPCLLFKFFCPLNATCLD